MKKIINTLFIAILTIFIFITNVNAADTNIFSVTNAQGAQGEEVTIILSLNKEIEFASADITLKYDTSKLEYVKYTELDIFKKIRKIAIGYVSNPDSASLVKKPGQMLSITFKIKSNVEETTKIDIECKSLKKDSGESIDASDIQSIIKIVTKKNNTNDDNDEQPKGNENNNNNNNNNKPVKAQEEKSKALPYTGKNIVSIGLIICILTIISYYFYKKYRYLRKI